MFLGQSLTFWLAAGVFTLAAIVLAARLSGWQIGKPGAGERPPLPEPPPPPPEAARLSLTPASGGRPLLLTADELSRQFGVCFGRSPEFSDVVLTDRQVSRRHCRFRDVEGRILVEDLNSTQGTSIDDVAIPPFKPVALKQGATLRLSDISFWVAIGPP